MPTIICLTGLARSGKDTSADYLVTRYQQMGLKVIKLALADRVKVICQQLIKMFYGLEIPMAHFYDDNEKEREYPEYPQFNGKVFKLRTIMQDIGSEIVREKLWADVWCDYIYRNYILNSNLKVKYDIIIISDCRFSNEITYFRDLYFRDLIAGCHCFRINNPNRKMIDSNNQKHQSETQIQHLNVDKDILNDGGFDVLYRQLDSLIKNDIKLGA